MPPSDASLNGVLDANGMPISLNGLLINLLGTTSYWSPGADHIIGTPFTKATDGQHISVTELSNGIFETAISHLGKSLRLALPLVSVLTNTATLAARDWTPPVGRDPLVLDLDGGGITTSGVDPLHPILFDQDGDGTRTGSGWIAAGEAIVVRDLNGNGLIDSGRELFGDSTILTHGPNAGHICCRWL